MSRDSPCKNMLLFAALCCMLAAIRKTFIRVVMHVVHVHASTFVRGRLHLRSAFCERHKSNNMLVLECQGFEAKCVRCALAQRVSDRSCVMCKNLSYIIHANTENTRAHSQGETAWCLTWWTVARTGNSRISSSPWWLIAVSCVLFCNVTLMVFAIFGLLFYFALSFLVQREFKIQNVI